VTEKAPGGNGSGPGPRPAGITALAVLFAFGTLMSLTASISLLVPGSVLEPMWRLNPRARVGFESLGGWAVLLLAVVSLVCSLCAAGFWLGRPWGYRIGFYGLGVNLLADAANGILADRRALVGIPVALAILAYLRGGRARSWFGLRYR